MAADVYARHGPALKAANAMDFDDLMLHPLTLFREHPDRLRAYQQRFSFILVDEFQDTNRAQYELIRLLGAHGNVCAVGDDDQSIYGWRGADVRNMQDFLTDFPGAKLVRLEENYRSTQIVLDAANGVIAENSGRIGKTLTHPPSRAARRSPCSPRPTSGTRPSGWCASWSAGARRATGATPRWRCSTAPTRSRRALEEAFRRAGHPVPADRRDQLLRAAGGEGPARLPPAGRQPLRRRGVPPRGRRAPPRTRRHQPRDPRADGGAVEQAAARHRARRRDRIPELRPNVREAFRSFAAFIDGLAERASRLAPADVLEQVIRAIDYEAVLHAEGPEGADRWENVRELVASAADWSEEVTDEPESGTPLERFLAEAALLSSAETVIGNEEGVTLMTLHTAKGLEWPVVVLTGLEHGLFPLARAEEQPDGLEEERRLCYVGLTRAKDKLYLTWARAPAPRRRAAAGHPLALPQGASSRHRGGAQDHLALGARLAAGQRDGEAKGRAPGAARAARPYSNTPTARAPDAAAEEIAGRAPLRQRRAGAAPPLRQRDHPGSHRHGPRSQGVGRLRRRGSRREAAARGLRRPRARMGERMSIGRNDVLHVAKLAELAVREEELDRLVDQLNRIVDYVAQLDRGARRPDGRAVPSRPARPSLCARTCPGRSRSPGRRRTFAPEFADGLLPGAAPRRHGGVVTGAVVGRAGDGRAAGRRGAAQRDAALVAGAARRRGRAGGRHARARARSRRCRSRSRTTSSPSSSRPPAAPGSSRATSRPSTPRR